MTSRIYLTPPQKNKKRSQQFSTVWQVSSLRSFSSTRSHLKHTSYLMHKQQASSFVAYKVQHFYESLSEKKIQINQHSVHVKSALIINFTQSWFQEMLNMIKPSFMFPELCLFSFQNKLSFNSSHWKPVKRKKVTWIFNFLAALKGQSDLSSKNMSK